METSIRETRQASARVQPAHVALGETLDLIVARIMPHLGSKCPRSRSPFFEKICNGGVAVAVQVTPARSFQF